MPLKTNIKTLIITYEKYFCEHDQKNPPSNYETQFTLSFCIPMFQVNATFEVLVLGRQEELSGPSQHCTIRIGAS